MSRMSRTSAVTASGALLLALGSVAAKTSEMLPKVEQLSSPLRAQEIQLTEVRSIPFGTGATPIRDVRDVAVFPDETAVILDGVSGRLHLISLEGALIKSRRIPTFEEGGPANLLVPVGTDSLLVLSAEGPGCAWYEHSLTPIPGSCDWDPPLVHVQGVIRTPDGYLTIARWRDSRAVMHLVGEDLRTVVKSVGEAPEIQNSSDSTILNWGLGVAAYSRARGYWYSEYAPSILTGYDERLQERVQWTDFGEQRETDSFMVRTGTEERSLLDLFERSTALESIGPLLLHASYFPLEDLTTFRIFDPDRDLVSTASVPFRLDVHGVSNAGRLVAVRHLGNPDLCIYAMSIQ